MSITTCHAAAMRRRDLAIACLLSLLAAGCGGSSEPTRAAEDPSTVPPSAGPTSAAPSPSASATGAQVRWRRVTFPSSGGARLVGRVFQPGRGRAIVLAHQVDTDQTDWLEFARELASNGYTVLTFNFQGACGGGCSGGGVPTAELWTDIVGAVAFLEERGAERIGLVGASLGGEASVAAAARLGSRVSAVVTLSASLGLAETGLGDARRDAAAIVAPTLFVAGESDAGAVQAARSFWRVAREPKRLEIVPFGEHGVELLRWEPGEHVRPLVLRFLHRALR